MKKAKQTIISIFILIISIFSAGTALALDWVGDYRIEDSGDIAALSGYTAVTGTLTIGSDPDEATLTTTTFENLTGLESLTIVGGDLFIGFNFGMTTMTGLNNLTSVGGALGIGANPILTSMSGLNNLTSVGGNMGIGVSPALTSLSALSKLTSIGGFLAIKLNTILTNLGGLENLTSVGGDLYIQENDALTNLCALYNVNLAGDELSIYENTLLSMDTANALEAQLIINGFTGTSDIRDNNGSGLVSCDTCVPTVECSPGAECGTEPDGCGGTIDCGTCDSGDSCVDNICVPDCVPETECSLGAECGSEPDGCGGTIDCGTCDSGDSCVDNICVPSCVPVATCTEGAECGTEPDGCGGTIDCGTCDSGDSCVDNICVPDCVPETECSLGAECGSEPDGCGGTIDCGTCPVGDLCIDNICDTCVSIPACEVSECGLEEDGCGGINDCGECPVGESCVDNICEEAPDNDDDGDGVTNGNDNCPDTPVGEIVDSDGCTVGQLVDQLVPCEGPTDRRMSWKNHGAYVSNLARTLNDFVERGLISEDEKDDLMEERAGSGCGKRGRTRRR